MNTFGENRSKLLHWIEASINALDLAIEKKRVALLKHKFHLTNVTLQIMSTIRNNAQKTDRLCANKFSLNVYKSIQISFDTGDFNDIHERINKVMWPNKCKTAPL